MNLDAITHAAQSSGGILYVMAVLFFIALTVALERSWHLARVTGGGQRLLAAISPMSEVSESQLIDLAEKYRRLPFAQVLQAAAAHEARHDFDRLGDRLDESMMRAAQHTDRWFWVLDTIITLAPLLGLLGTIIGMFNAFQVLSSPSNAPTQITGGVAEALLATASGLFVAMVGLVFFNGLNIRVRHVLQQMEMLKTMLTNRMYAYRHNRDSGEEHGMRRPMQPITPLVTAARHERAY